MDGSGRHGLEAGLVDIALDGRTAILASRLEDLHRAPTERFIATTAMSRGLPLMTTAERLLDWRGQLERMDH